MINIYISWGREENVAVFRCQRQQKGVEESADTRRQTTSDEKSHPLDLSVVCAKSFCCSDDSWKNQYFVKSK